jgi:hypothetical protein
VTPVPEFFFSSLSATATARRQAAGGGRWAADGMAQRHAAGGERWAMGGRERCTAVHVHMRERRTAVGGR